jgi:hypothetical protein
MCPHIALAIPSFRQRAHEFHYTTAFPESVGLPNTSKDQIYTSSALQLDSYHPIGIFKVRLCR